MTTDLVKYKFKKNLELTQMHVATYTLTYIAIKYIKKKLVYFLFHVTKCAHT